MKNTLLVMGAGEIEVTLYHIALRQSGLHYVGSSIKAMKYEYRC